MSFKNLAGKFLPPGACNESLGCKVKEERVVVVEFVEHLTLFLSDETLPEGERKVKEANRTSL